MEGLVPLILVIVPALLLLVLIRVLVFYPVSVIAVSISRPTKERG
jgi:hypothetical protein